MSVVKYVTKRYLRFDKKQPFISITGILAFLGVTVGVMVLIIAMSIMNGMSKEFQKKLFTMNYPLTIYPKHLNSIVNENLLNELKGQFPTMKFSPYIKAEVITKKGDSLNGAMMYGVDFRLERELNSVVKEAIIDKEVKDFDIVIGDGLFNELNLEYEDKLKIIFSDFTASGLSLIPKIKNFTVKSKFRSGLIAYDKAYIYTDINSLKKVMQKENFDGIHIDSVNPMQDIKILKEFLKPNNVGIVGWWEQNGNFFSAMEVEKRALFIVLMLIVLVASLNIISSLLMTVMNRRKEIALLLSLGASKSEIKKIFLYLGLIIGLGGVILGTILGFSGMFILSHFDIIKLPADVYGTSHIPIDLDMFDFWTIILGSFVIIFLSSLYPAKRASEIDILNVLRNE